MEYCYYLLKKKNIFIKKSWLIDELINENDWVRHAPIWLGFPVNKKPTLVLSSSSPIVIVFPSILITHSYI